MRRRNDQGFTDHAQVAQWYDDKYTEMGGGWVTPVEELDRHIDDLLYGTGSTPPLPGDMEVVDLGCGDGQFLVRLLSRYPEAFGVGVDVSYVARRLAESRAMEARVWSRMYITSAPIERMDLVESESCDAAISLGSMEHCLDIPKAVQELVRVLKPGGRWLIYAPNEKWVHEDQPLETTMSAEEWLELFYHAGLLVEHWEERNDNNVYFGNKRP
jgi:ubiquinone/menaquinone biosynthesis C-methylase UbiE